MTPGHQQLSAWYHQLAQQLEAGISLPAALRLPSGTRVPQSSLEAMAQLIEAGGSTDDALRSADWLPFADRLFLSAAATAGRMPAVLHVLSERHAQLGVAKVRVVVACLYPVALVNLCLLLLPVVRMIDWEKGFLWDPAAYLRVLACTLLPLWLVGFGFWILLRRQNAVVQRVTLFIPIVRSYLKARSLSDFSFGLGNFLEAGVPIGSAWEAAGLVSRSRELQSAADAVGVAISRGQQPGLMLGKLACFPPDFVALYRSGEISGQLEANLRRLAAQSHDKAHRALKFATMVYPGIMFLGAAGGVAYFVISIYAGYLKMLSGLADQ